MTTATGTYGPAVADFFASNLLITEGEKKGQPFILDPWQRDILDMAYEVDADGMRCWREVLIGIPRGEGKSPLIAGIALRELVSGTGTPTVHCAAAAKEQAGVVYGFAYDMVENGPLRDWIELPRSRRGMGPITCPHNDGILKALSADGLLQHGRNPSVIIFDELHAFTTGKQEELYYSQTTTLHKRPDSVMFTITTAGADKASLLGEKYDAIIHTHELEYRDGGCLTIGRDPVGKSLLIWYGAPDGADVSDPAVWRGCNPASWITDDSLRLAAHREPESVFRRLYLNQWVKGEDAAIQPAAWDALVPARGGVRFTHPVLHRGSEVWVGVDLGEKRDTSAVAWVSPRPNGKVRVGANVFLSERRSGMETTLPQVEAELRRLCDTYHVRCIHFDAWQMRDLAARLASESMPMVEFGQTNTNMVPASQLTFDMIADGLLVHDGDATLRAHVLGTGGETTATGGWRFTKAKNRTGNRDLSKNNDAMIALSMALAAWSDDTKSGGDLWVL
jgi:phage terminase large subunit-like protein